MGKRSASQRLAQLVLDALGPRAVARHRHRAAGPAPIGHPLAVAAVMAGDEVPVAVQHEGHVAVGAQPYPPAGAAGEEVGPPTAVEQQDRLAAGAAQVGQRHARLGVKRLVAVAHVEHLHGGHRAAVDALGETQALHGQHALGPRRGAAEDEHRAVAGGALAGDRAGVVARVALVLVGALVLLVDDDQPDVVKRREHRRARADAHPRLAGAQAHPLVVALADAQRRVQHRHHVAEAGLKAPQHLRGERDLGHEHDRRAPGRERRLHRPEIDLGLARAGDPLEQEPGVARGPSAQGRRQALERDRLLAGEGRRRGRGAADLVADGPPRARPTVDRDEAPGLQPPQPRRVELGGGGRPAPGQRVEQPALVIVEAGAGVRQRRPPGGGELGDEGEFGARADRRAGREHQLQRARRRRAVLAGHPVRRGPRGRRRRRPRGPPRARPGGRDRARSARPVPPRPRASCARRTAPAAATRPRRPGRAQGGSRRGRAPRASG